MSRTTRTARRLVGALSLAGAIALITPTAASANAILGGGTVEDAVETTEETAGAVTEATAPEASESQSSDPVDEVLDPVEDAVDTVTGTVTEATGPAPEPVRSAAETGAETADSAADTVTETVRSVAGVPDDDGDGSETSPNEAPVGSPVFRSETPQRGAGTSPTRQAAPLPPIREGLTVQSRSRSYLPGLALAAPQVAPADVIADPLVRSGVPAPALAPPTLASAPTGPVGAIPELPGGIATEIAIAAALLVLATGSLLYELGPERATA